MSDFRFCPRCASPLERKEKGGRERPLCSSPGCGYVQWDNPLPVVAAVIEHEGQMLLVRNVGWPEKLFALVTGFLERDESPEEGVLREVREETGLEGEVVELLGVYPFAVRNEVIVAYFVRTRGEVKLGDELAAYKLIAKDKLKAWPFGTGLAVQAWLDRYVPKAR